VVWTGLVWFRIGTTGLQMAVRFSAICTGRAILPTNIIFLLLEGLRKLRNFIHLIGSQTRNVPACGIASEEGS
jgi:hypothetical protein